MNNISDELKEKLMKAYADILGIESINKLDGFRIRLAFDKENTKKQDGLFLFREAPKYKRLKLEYKDGVIGLIFDVKGDKDEAFNQIIDFIKLVIAHNESIKKD